MESQSSGMAPVLSIVIPAYNSEKFIQRTLSSLLEQTACPECYEIILVDDGSTDATLEICRDFAGKYTNLRVKHQENKGVSAARNLGVSLARGKWITFVDSDDYVMPHYVQTMITTCPEAEYVIFDNYLEKNGCRMREKDWLQPFADQVTDAVQVLPWICDQRLNVPWDKRYDLELIRKENIRFSVGISMGEDMVFNLRYAMHAKTACIRPEALYVYTENPDGLTGSRYTAARFTQMEKLYDLTQQLCIDNQTEAVCLEMLDRSFLRGIARCGGQLCRAGLSHRQISGLFDRSEMVRKVLACKTASPKDIVRKVLLKNHLYSLCAVLISAK